MGESLDVLLANEAERREERERPRVGTTQAPLLEREPDEPEGRQDSHHLGRVREVVVHRAGIGRREGIRERVRAENASGGDGSDEDPREQPA